MLVVGILCGIFARKILRMCKHALVLWIPIACCQFTADSKKVVTVQFLFPQSTIYDMSNIIKETLNLGDVG